MDNLQLLHALETFLDSHGWTMIQRELDNLRGESERVLRDGDPRDVVAMAKAQAACSVIGQVVALPKMMHRKVALALEKEQE